MEPAYIDQLTAAGLTFSGRHPEFPIMQVLELPAEQHPFFIGAQFHPELTSRPLTPNPLFMGLVAAAIRAKDAPASCQDIPERWTNRNDHNSANGSPMAETS